MTFYGIIILLSYTTGMAKVYNFKFNYFDEITVGEILMLCKL